MRRPQAPPDIRKLVETDQPERFRRVVQALTDGSARAATNGHYLHWDDLRHRSPPPGLKHDEWWAALKMVRAATARELPLKDPEGRVFRYSVPDEALESLRLIDSRLSGTIALDEAVATPDLQDRYLLSSLMEEAVSSSLLEGAVTTYRVAKDMLRSGRAPRTAGERMVLNNFEAMRAISGWRDRDLTSSSLLELHRTLVKETIDPPDAAGRLRRSDEDVVVRDEESGETVHVPPPAQLLDARLKALLDFANERTPKEYVHPVIRAILIHFWLAYEHPFVDGNGRASRGLFFWRLLHSGYWLGAYVPLSRILRRAAVAYARSYQLTATDDNDVTYFLLHQLRSLVLGIDDLERYLKRKQSEVREAERKFREEGQLNHRQLALLSHSLRHPDAIYTIESHRGNHGIVYATARADLFDLVSKGLLESERVRRRFVFRPVRTRARGGRGG